MAVPLAVSVVIRTFNSAKTLEQVIERLGPSNQDELIVVDSGSTDSTLEIAKRLGARLVQTKAPFNYSRSLNLGFDAAVRAWVLVLSSHCIPMQREHLARLRRLVAGFPPTIAVAYFPTRLASVTSEPEDAARFFNRQEWEKSRARLGGNTHALYRLDCWRQHKFDETLATAEDLEWFLWAMRAGYSAAQCSGPGVLYRNQANMRRMFTKGLIETRAARAMLGSRGIRFYQLCLGLGSFVKKTLLQQIPLKTCLGQSAHQLGAFLGSRGAAVSANDGGSNEERSASSCWNQGQPRPVEKPVKGP
jgi:glycosyltransferase involved in cell wall biosynthesis